jgi:hypothetical protein
MVLAVEVRTRIARSRASPRHLIVLLNDRPVPAPGLFPFRLRVLLDELTCRPPQSHLTLTVLRGWCATELGVNSMCEDNVPPPECEEADTSKGSAWRLSTMRALANASMERSHGKATEMVEFAAPR